MLIVACSGGHTAPQRPDRPRGHGSGSAIALGADDHDCDALIHHALALGMAEQRATQPPDRVPTDDQQAAVERELRASYGATCRAMSRGAYQCAVTAPTLAALAGCR